MIPNFIKEKFAGLMLVAAFLAPCQSLLTKAETITENFNDNSLPEGWSIEGTITHNGDRAKSGNGLWCSDKSDDKNYIITPEMEGEISFYARTYNKGSYGYVIFYKISDDTKLGDLIKIIETGKEPNTPTFKEYKLTLETPGRVAIALNYSCIDDFTYTPAEKIEGPAIQIIGYKTGSTYDFGSPVPAGTVAEFNLTNIGNSPATINSINVSGGYTLTWDETEQILPGEKVKIEVATPAEDAEGELIVESDDPNSPYIVTLKSTYKRPVPVMVLGTTSISFGKVASDTTYNITVDNTGDAPLEVTAESSSEYFTVSPSTLTVEEGASGTLAVTFLYDGAAYGIYDGTLTITPNAGDAVEIPLSAKIADPNIWCEEFNNNELPSGWQLEGNYWTFADGVAKGQYAYNVTSYLTTPSLIVEGPEDELSFDYKARGYYVDITIEASKDNAPFAQIEKFSAETTDYKTKVISGLEAGTYSFRFKNDDYNLDNFEGLRLNLNAPEMEISPMQDAEFGKVTSMPESKTYTVSNKGTGKYSVTITSSSDDFTVSPQQLIDIENGEPQTFTVTFNYDGENPGYKKAEITIVPDYSPEAAITFNATAEAKDPNIWEEDFEEGVMPPYWTTTGWTVTNKYHNGNGTYMAFAGTESADYTLTTPRLYAKEGQKLEFEIGAGTDTTDKLTVEYSHDNTNWEPIPDSPLEAQGTYCFTAPRDDYYYLKFNGKYGTVDNFTGFKLSPKEHDIAITGQQIPTNGHQYADYIVKVTLQEMTGQDEEVEAVLYFNNEIAVAVSETVEASTTKDLQFVYVPVLPAENAQAYVTVRYAGNETVSTSVVTVNIAAAATLDESGTDGNIEEGRHETLVLNYTVQPGWNTIAVPFELNDDHMTAIFGETYETYELKSFDGSEITFQYPTQYAAGYPYVVYVKPSDADLRLNETSEGQAGVVLHDVNITKSTPGFDFNNGVYFSGTFEPLSGNGASMYEITNDMKLRWLDSDESIAGFRGYLTLPENLAKLPTLKFVDGNGVETGVDTVGEETSPEIIFTLEGIRIEKITKPGIYIVNGKKILKTQVL